MIDVKSRWKRWGRLGIVIVAAPVLAWIGACGTDRPGAGANGTNPPPATGNCGTPNEGCECSEPAQVVPCGTVEHTSSDGFVTCSMGHRTCLGTRWGTCVGETDVTIQSTTNGLHTAALGGSGKCGTDAGGPSNPCDPYCNGFVDTASGLPCAPGSVGSVDGGLGVCPATVPDAGGPIGIGTPGYGGAPPTLVTTTTGNSTCGAAASEAHAGACTLATQYRDCQQDFRCDPTTLTCQWNGANNFYDSTAGAADLTVGAGCDNGTTHVPVCNRGSTFVPSGTTITIDLLNPAQYTAWNTGACPTLPGPPSCSTVLSTQLDPGACVDVTGCALGAAQYAVVNSEALPVPEAPGRCANNAAFVQTAGAPGCAACTLCNTQLSGKIYDPSGYGVAATNNNLPLPGISIFETTVPPPPMVDGVTCDTCQSLEGATLVKAVTDYKGAFLIDGITPGTKITMTIQAGRWRRQVQIPITACVMNKAPAFPGAVPFVEGTFRLPNSRTDGLGGQANIPKTAIVTGSKESTECLFAKMGVLTSEITSPTSATPAAGGGRIHIYKDKGLGVTPPQVDVAPGVLWASQASLDQYTASIYPCSASSETSQGLTVAQTGFYANHVAKGGHALFNHHAADSIFLNGNRNPTLAASSTWVAAGAASPFHYLVNVGTAPQQTLFDWLSLYGGMATWGPPFIDIPDGDNQSITPLAGKTTVWMYGRTNNVWTGGPPPTNEDFTGSFSFEMGNVAGVPTIDATCGPSGGHGRVFFNGMHVSPTRSTSVTGLFPAKCAAATVGLTEAEKALEFHIFQLTQCQLGGAPPPPPPTPLASATFVRDFAAVCPVGTRAKWAPFYWEAVIPPATSIDIRAATSDVLASLPTAPPVPGAPTTAKVTKVIATTVPATAWDCQGCPGAPVSVDSQLLTDTGLPSASFLRVYMTFNPTATLTPSLTAWRQVYDCVPAE